MVFLTLGLGGMTKDSSGFIVYHHIIISLLLCKWAFILTHSFVRHL